MSARESKSRPYAGILAARTRGLNQDGDVCVSWERTFMVYRRGAPLTQGHFPQAKAGPLGEQE